ncbi:MAG TPA: hypothetical protein VME45_01575 [Stellaceae bacterium]|nr:hypothetical protein [Stellaceae bacterium]
MLLLSLPAAAQQQPTPLFNAQPLPPLTRPAPDQPAPAPQPVPVPMPPAAAPAQPAPAPAAQAGRVFCGQSVTAHAADPRSVPEAYRQFVGIFSDAAWNAQLCAALIVETISADGTATITYVFGPLDSGGRTPGGVLHGTGIVKDGALLFQNSDGSQYAFQPFYSDLSGKWTTPQGQTYEAIFKRAF